MVLNLIWPDDPPVQVDPQSSAKYVTVNISDPAIDILQVMAKEFTKFDQTDPTAKAQVESIKTTIKELWKLLNP